METMDEALFGQISRHCDQGDELADGGRFDEALKQYQAAWKLLPDPKEQWEAAPWILTAMGDVRFLKGSYRRAAEDLTAALGSISALDNPFIYLRLGQSRFELGEEKAAVEALQTAYDLDDGDLWQDEDPKYLKFLAAHTDGISVPE